MSFTFGDVPRSPTQEYVLAKQNYVSKVNRPSPLLLYSFNPRQSHRREIADDFP